jgi:hypothetical protein
MERIKKMVDIIIGGINGTGSQTGTVEIPGNVDRFNITLRGGEQYEFLANATSSLDPTLTLNRPAGPPKFNDDISSTNHNSRILHQAGSNTASYSLDVAGFNSSTGSYKVIANEVPANASTYSTLTVGGQITGDLHGGGDQDFHKLTLSAGRTYRFNMDGADFGSGPVQNPFLQIRDSAGTVLASNIGANDANPATRNSEITFKATTSGTFFANAQGFFGSSEFPDIKASGGYKLSAAQIA